MKWFAIIVIFCFQLCHSAQHIRMTSGVQSLDENESSTAEAVVANGIEQERTFKVVVPSGFLIFSSKLLKHAEFFKPLIADDRAIDEININHVLTVQHDVKNPWAMCLQDVHDILQLIASDPAEALSNVHSAVCRGSHASRCISCQRLISWFITASYLEIPPLISVLQQLIECLSPEYMEQQWIEQLPDDLQAAVTSKYVKK